MIFVISEVLRGLGYAHDLPVGTDVRGIVHRDVSPHNVLLSWEGAVKVSDFGIAKARAASEATASVFIKGKPAYMSPEQANGQALDGRSDLFAVGVMLWEMLCGGGCSPARTHARRSPVLFGRSRRRARSPRDPEDLERVVLQLLARDRAARYASAEAALADLFACGEYPRAGRDLVVDLLEARVRNTTRPQRKPHPAPLPGPIVATAPHRRRGVVIAAALGAVAAASVAVLVVVLRGDDGPAPPDPARLVERARAAVTHKSYPEAAALFRQAFAVDHYSETLRQVGDAERSAFDCASAIAA